MNPAPENDQAQDFHKSGNTGLAHLRNSVRFSYKGLIAAFKYESAFRQELAFLVLLIPLGLWISNSALQFTLLMVVASFVLVIELLNSAVEAAIDRISLEHHPLSGRAKDLGSAAVMVALILAGAVWLVTLLEYLAIL